MTLNQKSGNLYALDAATGKFQWATVTSPGGPGSGLMWGVAADDARVYSTAINFPNLSWTLVVPSNVTTTGSGLRTAGLEDGKVVWSIIAAPGGRSCRFRRLWLGICCWRGGRGPPPTGVPPVSAGPGGMLALYRETGGVGVGYGWRRGLRCGGTRLGAVCGVAVQDRYLCFCLDGV